VANPELFPAARETPVTLNVIVVPGGRKNSLTRTTEREWTGPEDGMT
jgi:hypothetical protein